jgi:hypothetical protein
MNEPTEQQLAILADYPNAVLHFGGKRPVKKKSRPTVFHRDGYTTIGERANYWCERIDDWWKWEGDSESDIIAYIPDPRYPQPPQSIPDELGAQGMIGGLWRDKPESLFKLGDLVTKKSGASWTGYIVGSYSTELTPIGFAVESVHEKGSVQIYPQAALEAVFTGGAILDAIAGEE